MEMYDRIRAELEQIQKAEAELTSRRGNWNEFKELARCNWCSSIFSVEQGFQSSMADDYWYCSVACENQYLEDKEWDNVLFNEAESLTDEDMAWLTHASCDDPSCRVHGDCLSEQIDAARDHQKYGEADQL